MSKLFTQRGYTLLFAVLTATLVLGVAVFILSLSRKQYELAATARESTYAFYAADSGIECSAYAVKNGIVASTTNDIPDHTTATNLMQCGGKTITIPTFAQPSNFSSDPVVTAYGFTNEMTSGQVLVPLQDSSCSMVRFTTGLRSNVPILVIESRGYNLCNSSGPIRTSSQTVERALRLTLLGLW